MLAILILIFILILALPTPTLLHHGYCRALLVFSCFYLVGVFLGLAQFYGWPIYNPFEALLTILGNLPGGSVPVLVGWAGG